MTPDANETQLGANIAHYADVYAKCLLEAARILPAPAPQDGEAMGLRNTRLFETADVLFNRYWDDQLEMMSQANRQRTTGDLVETFRNVAGPIMGMMGGR